MFVFYFSGTRLKTFCFYQLPQDFYLFCKFLNSCTVPRYRQRTGKAIRADALLGRDCKQKRE